MLILVVTARKARLIRVGNHDVLVPEGTRGDVLGGTVAGASSARLHVHWHVAVQLGAGDDRGCIIGDVPDDVPSVDVAYSGNFDDEYDDEVDDAEAATAQHAEETDALARHAQQIVFTVHDPGGRPAGVAIVPREESIDALYVEFLAEERVRPTSLTEELTLLFRQIAGATARAATRGETFLHWLAAWDDDFAVAFTRLDQVRTFTAHPMGRPESN